MQLFGLNKRRSNSLLLAIGQLILIAYVFQVAALDHWHTDPGADVMGLAGTSAHADLHADGLLKPAYWSLNIGLAMMVFMSLLPAGIYQAWASITKGLWYARSAEFVHSPVMETLVWLRVPGDILFAAGAAFLALYALRLLGGGRGRQSIPVGASAAKGG